MSKEDRAELLRVSKRAGGAFNQGLVHLVQHRHGIDDYSYLMIMRPRPKTAQPSMSASENHAVNSEGVGCDARAEVGA
jgi:hypothetical protein